MSLVVSESVKRWPGHNRVGSDKIEFVGRYLLLEKSQRLERWTATWADYKMGNQIQHGRTWCYLLYLLANTTAITAIKDNDSNPVAKCIHSSLTGCC